MSNEIDIAEPNYFELYGRSASTRSIIVGDLLLFTKFGEYKYGQQGDLMPFGTKLVAVMKSLSVGWVKWQDNRPVAHEMGRIDKGYQPPRRDTLGDNDRASWDHFDDGSEKDPWVFTNHLILVDPDDTDLVYTFSTSSKTGISAIGEVSEAYGKRLRQFPDEYPVIEMNGGRYTHRQYGEQRIPVFKIVAWVAGDSYNAQLINDENASSEPAAAAPSPAAALKAPQPAVSKPAVTNQSSPTKPTATKKPPKAVNF